MGSCDVNIVTESSDDYDTESDDSAVDAMDCMDFDESEERSREVLLAECERILTDVTTDYNTKRSAFGSTDDGIQADSEYIDECCQVFIDLMCDTNIALLNESVFHVLMELWKPFLESGFLTEELVYDHLAYIYAEFKEARPQNNVIERILAMIANDKNDQVAWEPEQPEQQSGEPVGNPVGEPVGKPVGKPVAGNRSDPMDAEAT